MFQGVNCDHVDEVDEMDFFQAASAGLGLRMLRALDGLARIQEGCRESEANFGRPRAMWPCDGRLRPRSFDMSAIPLIFNEGASSGGVPDSSRRPHQPRPKGPGAVSNLPRPGKTKERPAEPSRGTWPGSTAWTSQVLSGQRKRPQHGGTN
jgi:hypothetical protein